MKEYIENVCPNCAEIVEFSEKDLEEFDGHHFEITCPHCNKFCCFVCGHVY